MTQEWMIYGASGYTGRLVAEEAVARGHRPLLAGRSAEKLRPLADRLGLEYVTVGLDEREKLAEAVGRVKLVYHAAGPFTYTSVPMLRACLVKGAHYVDLTGEIPAIQKAFDHDAMARERGVVIIPGAGFDVIPSDCLLKYVADQVPDATHLEVALDALGTGGVRLPTVTAGTTRSELEILARVGNATRQDGRLKPMRLGAGAKTFHFAEGGRRAIPVSWADLEMGYRTTGIPNITAYLTLHPAVIGLLRLTGWAVPGLMQSEGLRKLTGQVVGGLMRGPSAGNRAEGRSHIYARAWTAKGESREAWMETSEAYQYTVKAAPLVVERVLEGDLKGALTPALALGTDFALAVEGTRRFDRLPGSAN